MRLRANGMATSAFVASQTLQGRGETACGNILLEHVWFACRNISYRRLCIHHSCNLTHQGTKMKEVKQVTQIEGHTKATAAGGPATSVVAMRRPPPGADAAEGFGRIWKHRRFPSAGWDDPDQMYGIDSTMRDSP